MKAQSNVKPNQYEIENINGDRCDILFATNIVQEEDNENVIYKFELYGLNACYKENIQTDIEENFEEYLNAAKNYEKNKSEKQKQEREWRNEELDRMDKQLVKGYPKKYSEKTILNYKQALRDYPEKDGFPYDCDRPEIEDYVD